jgi:putative flavoprotein involved in K+ transport
VLVIGAGPAGLATAASLKQLGIAADLVDRFGQPGGAYARLDAGIQLSSPADSISMPGLPIETNSKYITIGEYRKYLQRYAAHFNLQPTADSIERIERRGEWFFVKLAGEWRPRRYESVVVASGMCEHPVMPNIPGLTDAPADAADRPRVMHSRDWPGHAALAGQRILIIGGASSAIAIAEQCAAAGIKTVLSTRRGQIRFSWTRLFGIDWRQWIYPLTRRLPRWLFRERCSHRPAFAATEQGFHRYEQAGLIDVRGGAERFEGREAKFADGSSASFDAVVLATGFRFTMPFLPAEVARAPAGQPLAEDGESPSWPGMYFVGIPCGRSVASEFLHGMAADAPIVARRIQKRLTVKATR